MWYRLNGVPSSMMCWAAKRANGTVRSNRSPTSRPPWSCEPVELLVGLVAPLAGEDLQILQRRRVDRAESVRAVDPSSRVDQPLAGNHRLRQRDRETLERAGLDAVVFVDAGAAIAQATIGSRSMACGLRILLPLGWRHGFHVLVHLLRRLEVVVVDPIVFVFAVVWWCSRGRSAGRVS